MRATHSGQLERWLGTEAIAQVSASMRGWYGPPIAMGGVPGAVYATGDGDFVGKIRAGYEATAYDRARDILRRLARATSHHGVLQSGGFATLTDFLTEARIGKRQISSFVKAPLSTFVNEVYDMWAKASLPAAGATGGAAPGGTVYTSASAGALPFLNALSGDKSFLSRMQTQSNANSNLGGGTLLIVDRLFAVAKTMNSTATEAVTGVPTRYQSNVTTDPDYAAGNFLFIGVTTTLPATAHNWTVCQYTDQDGNAGVTLPSVPGIVSNNIGAGDLPLNTFFAPLATGDTGVTALTQMQCDVLVASGAIEFSVNHPLGWATCPVANWVCVIDGVASALNLTRIFDNACLSLFIPSYFNMTSTTFSGQLEVVSG